MQFLNVLNLGVYFEHFQRSRHRFASFGVIRIPAASSLFLIRPYAVHGVPTTLCVTVRTLVQFEGDSRKIVRVLQILTARVEVRTPVR